MLAALVAGPLDHPLTALKLLISRVYPAQVRSLVHLKLESRSKTLAYGHRSRTAGILNI